MLTQTVSGRAFTYSHCIGRLAQGGTGLRFVMDVALAPGGIAYVLNRSSEAYPHGTRVTKLALGGQPLEEELILEFGRSGSGDGEFQCPTSVALDQSENAYVADEWLNQIVVFDKDGNFLKKWGVSGDGEGTAKPSLGTRLRFRRRAVDSQLRQEPHPKVHQGRQVPDRVGSGRLR